MVRAKGTKALRVTHRVTRRKCMIVCDHAGQFSSENRLDLLEREGVFRFARVVNTRGFDASPVRAHHSDALRWEETFGDPRYPKLGNDRTERSL